MTKWTFSGMPFTHGGDVSVAVVKNGKQAGRYLSKSLAVTVPHYSGSIVVWWGNDGQWHGQLSQYCVEKNSAEFQKKSEVAAWVDGVIEALENQGREAA